MTPPPRTKMTPPSRTKEKTASIQSCVNLQICLKLNIVYKIFAFENYCEFK